MLTGNGIVGAGYGSKKGEGIIIAYFGNKIDF